MSWFSTDAWRSRRRLVSAALIGWLYASMLASAPHAHRQTPATPRPSFQSSVNLVLVDMRVTRGDELVTDLKPDEVTLLVDGAPRAFVSLIYAPVVVADNQRPTPDQPA